MPQLPKCVLGDVLNGAKIYSRNPPKVIPNGLHRWESIHPLFRCLASLILLNSRRVEWGIELASRPVRELPLQRWTPSREMLARAMHRFELTRLHLHHRCEKKLPAESVRS